jgi:carboxypeptidase C (cathepsin A)
MRHLSWLAAALLVASCGGGGGGSTAVTPPPAEFNDPVTYSSAADASLASAAELKSVTQHQIVIGAMMLNYSATAGHLTARDLATNAPSASFFYVAYTADNANASTRPVTFFYNGGPGSSTVWLHLGSFGPKRLVTGFPATTQPAPFPLVDNTESLIDLSDLVFVDAVGTGFSQAIAPYANRSFWGVDADAAVFRDFVRRYVEANGRAASPKFLFGESYGTTRAAVMALALESAGVALKGVVLQSSILNYNANCGVVFGPVPCTGYVPSYGAAGAWYNLDQPNPLAAALPAFIAQMRTLAAERYAPAVRNLLSLGTPPDPALVAELANTTGMPAGQWQANFNLNPNTYQARLIAGTLIGRYDARVSAPVGSFLASEGDPSSTFITAPFTDAIAAYLSAQLRYTTPSSYTVTGSAIGGWNFSHGGFSLPDTIPDLAAAMALNPKLKVLSLNGYYDLATPFFATEQDLARLPAGASVQNRFYMGGHMTYLDDASRVVQKADLAQFYQAAVAPGSLKVEIAPTSITVPLPPRTPATAPRPATLEMPLLDPWVPPQLAKSYSPPTHGAELRAQVERKLRAGFDAADAKGAGKITRAEAHAAGLGFIVNHFDAIDRRRTGVVNFDDLKEFLRVQGAQPD